jgi:hypothetical protein
VPILDDYMDEDMAYLTGLIIARGTLEASPQRRLIISFPKSDLEATGISTHFKQDTSIKLGLTVIRERIAELLATDVQTVPQANSVDLVVMFLRNSMAWRNILTITEQQTSYQHYRVPKIFFEQSIPQEWKRQFVRGYGDAAGNVRKANLYVNGLHRVRLDTLNYPTNWAVPVQLCTLLQEHLDIPVHLITWGHPNMHREFREHQLNIFADEYLKIGFSFEHKQKILEELANFNLKHGSASPPKKCPGIRAIHRKESDSEEGNASKLDPRLVGKHFDGYWQICKALGCTRMPPDDGQGTLEFVEDAEKPEH